MGKWRAAHLIVRVTPSTQCISNLFLIHLLRKYLFSRHLGGNFSPLYLGTEVLMQDWWICYSSKVISLISSPLQVKPCKSVKSPGVSPKGPKSCLFHMWHKNPMLVMKENMLDRSFSWRVFQMRHRCFLSFSILKASTGQYTTYHSPHKHN